MVKQAGIALVAVVVLGIVLLDSVSRAAPSGSWTDVTREVTERLDAAMRAYDANDAVKAQDLVNDAYFGAFEERGMETAIRREISARHAREVEKAFAAIRQAMGKAESRAAVSDRVTRLRETLERDARELVRLGVANESLAEKERAPAAEAADSSRAVDADAVATQIATRLDEAAERYRLGDREQAKAVLASAYFDLFEAQGLEASVASRFPQRKAEIETGFSRIRGLMATGAPATSVTEALEALKGRVRDAAAVSRESHSRWAAFLNGLLIIVREGFEAILVITALAAYLLKSGHGDKVRTVYQASGLALLASVLTAVAIRMLLRVDPRHQETLEGATMLVATGVLFYVSYWLISKAEADRWQRYVRARVQASLGAGSLAALWTAAFLAVYREGAETVLFYQALLAGGDPGDVAAVLAGLGAGALTLVVLFLLLRTGALRIAIRPFFTVTSAMLYYLAFVFAGKGIRELQESGVIGTTPARGIPTWDIVGVYPTWESVGLQALLVCAAILAFAHLFLRRARAVRAEAVQP